MLLIFFRLAFPPLEINIYVSLILSGILCVQFKVELDWTKKFTNSWFLTKFIGFELKIPFIRLWPKLNSEVLIFSVWPYLFQIIDNYGFVSASLSFLHILPTPYLVFVSIGIRCLIYFYFTVMHLKSIVKFNQSFRWFSLINVLFSIVFLFGLSVCIIWQ